MTTTTNNLKTLDQKRAEHAWDAVRHALSKIGPHSEQIPKKFGGNAKKLPVRIMASGLGQALAFLRAKDYAPGLIWELSDWIGRQIPSKDGREDLLDRIVHGSSNDLRRATDEVLAYLQWLNRFAEAEGLADDE